MTWSAVCALLPNTTVTPSIASPAAAVASATVRVEHHGDVLAARRRVLGEHGDQSTPRLLAPPRLDQRRQLRPRVHDVVAVDDQLAALSSLAPREAALARHLVEEHRGSRARVQ